MHRSEDDDEVRCLQCGAEISMGRDRAYAVGEEDVLCQSCAMKRGGAYDERQDRWVEAPKLEGLPLREPSTWR
jgi:hypothetical protein